MLVLKIGVMLVVLVSNMFSVWKNSVGLVVPVVALWGYGVYDGFRFISVTGLVIFSFVHVIFQGVLYWYSNRFRESNLAFTGAGIIGFGTVILASQFFGALLGFFMWWGFIGRLVADPVSIGIRPIVKSFLAGTLKVAYAVVVSGVISYMLF